MDNIALCFCGIYLLPNESAGYGSYMFHAFGALYVVIGESSHSSLHVNFMNQIMEIYEDDLFLSSSLYQSNRLGRIINKDLPKYLDLQNNNSQWKTQLGILFISIVYGVWIRSVQWFGDAIIYFNNAIELVHRDVHQFVLPASPVIWIYFHIHTAPGFTGSGSKHFCTPFKFSASGAENQGVLTFQPYQPHILIYLLQQDTSPSSKKLCSQSWMVHWIRII